jgi:starch-binding outer membrane protein, SusD/RagB family
MKHKKIIFSMMLFCSMIVFNGCNDDFLNISPEATYSSDTYFQNQETAEQLITGCYSILQETWPNMYLYHALLGGDLRSDDALTGGDPEKPPLDRIRVATFDVTGDNPDISKPWLVYFAGIRRACDAVAIIEEIPEDKFDAPGIKERMIGEAKFLRALHYQYLVKLYGKVPLVDHPLSPEERNLPRAEVSVIYDFIGEDLTYAIEHLNWKAETEPGRATKGAAIYLLVNALVHEAKTDASSENWQKAYDLAHPMVLGEHNTEYSLIPSYGDLWMEGNDFNDETIFEKTDKADPELGSWYTVFTHPRFVEAEDGTRDGTFGWGVSCPTQDLVDAFEPGDPRLHYSVWMEGDTLQIGGTKNEGPRPVWLKDTPTGYYRKKVILKNMPVGYQSPVNAKLFRYPDLLLFFAEAAYYTGKEGEARDAVNRIRERAREGDNTILPDITSSGNQLLLDIWHERRIELNLEHHRFFDLVRQERVAEVMQAFGMDFIENKHELYPVPESEIQLAPGLLPNNPGY